MEVIQLGLGRKSWKGTKKMDSYASKKIWTTFIRLQSLTWKWLYKLSIEEFFISRETELEIEEKYLINENNNKF